MCCSGSSERKQREERKGLRRQEGGDGEMCADGEGEGEA